MTDDLAKWNPQESNPFEVRVPEPGEMFRARVIHPRNMQIENIRETAQRLPPSVFKQKKKRLKAIDRELERSGYNEIETEITYHRNRYVSIQENLAALATAIQSADPETAAEIRKKAYDLREQAREHGAAGAALIQDARKFAALRREKQEIEIQLYQHEIDSARVAAFDHAMQDIIKKEAHVWHDIIIETFSSRGFKHEYSVKGKTVTDRVRIDEIHISPDRIFFKIAVSQKTAFGWRSVLPQGVDPGKLIDESMQFHLSIACQRKVEPYATPISGVWLIVNRIESNDGLLPSVSYSKIMRYYAASQHELIPIPVGVKQGPEIQWLALARYPHFLVGGETGSGKSTVINNFIATIISRHPPDSVRLVLVDMKEGAEFSKYEDNRVPHLLRSVVTSPGELVEVLSQMESLRKDRMKELTRRYARNIDDYNKRSPQNERMPRIVVIIDEYAAKNMNDPYDDSKANKAISQQVGSLVSQLLAKSRAAGIHLVICSQTFYSELLPGPDKANISVKLAGRLTQMASRTVFGHSRAAEITAEQRGRMLLSTGGVEYLIQCPMVTDEDIDNAISAASVWDAPRPIELPTVRTESKDVSESDLIGWAIEENGGVFSVHKLWKENVRILGVMSFRQLRHMINQIYTHETVEHDGIVYRLKKQGSGMRLVAENSKIAE